MYISLSSSVSQSKFVNSRAYNIPIKDFAFTSPTQYFLFNLRLMEYEKGELNEEEFVNAVEKDFKEHQRLVAFNSKHWRDSDEEYAIAYTKEFG